MSYVDNNLLPNERVIYRAHLHWAVYIIPVFVLLFGLLGIASSAADAGKAFGEFLLVVGVAACVLTWIRVKTSEFAVTDKRVVIKVGLVRRRSIELLLRQIEGIGVNQGIFGRILGYGVIVVGGTGGTKEPFKAISDPLEFRKQVQMQSTQDQGAAPALGTSAGGEKTCPRCAESVKAAAKVCRFCNHEFA